MSYSIYTMFGYYSRDKFIVGGFKNLSNAKARCADIIQQYSRHADVKLEIVNSNTKKAVGWMSNSYMGKIGIYWEDLNGKVTRYGWN